MESLNLITFFTTFATEQQCTNYLFKARWPQTVTCPKCGVIGVKVYTLKSGRFKCATCRQTFTVRTGSIFEDSKLPLQKWFLALYLCSSLKKGISSIQLSKYANVTQKTAWFMLSRIRYIFNTGSFEQLKGEVEIDGSYIGGKEKNKHVDKRTKGTQGYGSAKTKSPMVGILERGGELRATVSNETDSKSLMTLIRQQVNVNAKIYSDEHPSYANLEKLGYSHKRVNHTANQWINGMAHTNGLEGFWSHLKRGVDGIFHHVSLGHLQLYLNEYTQRWNTREMTDGERFAALLPMVGGKRLTYGELIGKQAVVPEILRQKSL